MENELSFIDTFPSKIGANSVDDRPIRPRKNYQSQLDVIQEKVKSNNKVKQKQFLKKKPVYNPKESIMKEREYRRKAKAQAEMKSKASNSGTARNQMSKALSQT